MNKNITIILGLGVLLGAISILLFGSQPASAPSELQGMISNAVSNPTQSTTSTPAETKVVFKLVNDPKLGGYLTAENLMTLYAFTKDKPGVSNCLGDCLIKWPPYTVLDGERLMVGQGVSIDKVGTINRETGQLQLTYMGMPLYFWYQDAKPGDTKGENVGGVWFVVRP